MVDTVLNGRFFGWAMPMMVKASSATRDVTIQNGIIMASKGVSEPQGCAHQCGKERDAPNPQNYNVNLH